MMTDESGLDDQAAREYFLAGRNLYALGRFSEAAGQFQQAYDLSHRKQLLYNLYVAYRDAGDREHAASSLHAYLDQMDASELDPTERHNLEARLHALDEGLAQDRAAREEAERAAAEATRRDEEERARQERASGGGGASGGASPVPWIIAGVGGAALVVGVVTGIVALDAKSTLDAACDSNHVCPDTVELTDAYDRGSSLATATDVLFIAGGIVAAAGLTWGLIQLLGGGVEESEPPPVAAWCGPSGCGATVGGTF